MDNQIVVYLDIDGVLNNMKDHAVWRTDRHNTLFRVSPYNRGDFVSNFRLGILREWIHAHNAKVVIVSSWVVLNDTGKMICEFLELPYHSEAYNTGGGNYRGTGVLKHIADYGIKRWVIFDDARQMYDHEEILLQHLVHVQGGLTASHLHLADKII